MTLGEKIKNARKNAGITQNALAGDKITRNMISCIENGSATPSLDTLKYISDTLKLPISYFVSDNDDIFIHMKNQKIDKVKKYMNAEMYKEAIAMAESLPDTDDETAYILTECCSKYGRSLFMNGSLKEAEIILKKSLEFAKKTIYDTRIFENVAPMYLSICKNINAPLLDFDSSAFELGAKENEDYDFYKYMTMDAAYDFKNQAYKKHLIAKTYIKERNYRGALETLKDIVENKIYPEYNVYLMFNVYIDMENCYKQLFDFENAYRYSTKRISLIEGFGL